MPNWNYNVVKLSHTDSIMMEKLDSVLKNNENLFNSFVPMPEELRDTVSGSFSDPDEQKAHEEKSRLMLEKYGYANWYDWANDNWGTKWDSDADSHNLEDGVYTISFDTAWCPPLAFYEKMVEQGWNVVGYYSEPGMFFAGVWDNGDDCCYNDMKSVPEGSELDNVMGIWDMLAEFEEELED